MRFLILVLVACAPEEEPFEPAASYALLQEALVSDTCTFYEEGTTPLRIPPTLGFQRTDGGYAVDEQYPMECTLVDRVLTCLPIERLFPQDGADATIVQTRTLGGTFDERGVLLGNVRWEVECEGSDCGSMQSSRPIPCVQDVDADYTPVL